MNTLNFTACRSQACRRHINSRERGSRARANLTRATAIDDLRQTTSVSRLKLTVETSLQIAFRYVLQPDLHIVLSTPARHRTV